MRQTNLTRVAGEVFQLIQGGRRLSGEILWVIAGQVASVTGALVGVKLLTEVLPIRAYGEVALAMTASSLVNQIVAGPLCNACARFFAPASELGELRSYLTAVTRLTFLGNGVVAAFGLTGILFLAAAGYGNWISFLGATLIFSVLSGCNSMMDALQNTARQRSLVALHQGLGFWLKFLCAVGLVIALGGSSTIALWGYCIGSLLVFASQAWHLKRLMPPGMRYVALLQLADAERWKGRLIEYAWPIGLWGGLWWLYSASDRWGLQFFTSTEEVGLYAVVYQLGYYPLALLTGTISQFVGPFLFRLASDGTDEKRKAMVSQRNRLITIGALCLSVCCILAAALLHKQLFHLLTAEQYWDVSWLLPATATSGALFGTAQLVSLGLQSNYDTRFLLKPYLCTAILGAVLNFCGAFAWGLPGVIAAGITANGIYLLWMILLAVPSGTRTIAKALLLSPRHVQSDE